MHDPNHVYRPALLTKRYELLGHISLGVSSYERAKIFYDAVLRTIGGECVYDGKENRVLGYGPNYNPNLESLNLFEKKDASAPGSGFHLAFNAPDRRSVREFWEAAIKHGGTDAGKWGLRRHYGDCYYAAFVLDPDGNKLEAVFQEADEESLPDKERKHLSLMKEIMKEWDDKADRERENRVKQLQQLGVAQLEEEVKTIHSTDATK